MADVSLNQVIDRLLALGAEMKDTMDYSGITPQDGHHRSAMFIRLPYPAVAAQNGEVFERLSRLIESLNRPDTMKCDVYTVIGEHVLQGFQPHTDLTAKGSFDPEEIHKILPGQPYVLQMMVDIVQPQALEQTLKALE